MMIKNQKGFTLIELMMSVGASAMIAYAIFASMRISLNVFESNSVRMTIQTSAREGLYRMIQEIRESSPTRISITNSGQTITFTVPNSSTPVTSGYGVNWGTSQIRYALGSGSTAGQIIRTDLSNNTTRVMANDVTALTFTGNTGSPSVVTVAMSVQRMMINRRNIPATALQLTGQARVRNSG